MALTIVTQYKGPTNTRGAVIVAKVEPDHPAAGHKRWKRTVPYDHALSLTANHDHAAHCAAVFIGFEARQWVRGELNNGYCYVQYLGEVVEIGKGAAGRD
jgi:hypothetical protein